VHPTKFSIGISAGCGGSGEVSRAIVASPGTRRFARLA
jgi:hypothetical protein